MGPARLPKADPRPHGPNVQLPSSLVKQHVLEELRAHEQSHSAAPVVFTADVLTRLLLRCPLSNALASQTTPVQSVQKRERNICHP